MLETQTVREPEPMILLEELFESADSTTEEAPTLSYEELVSLGMEANESITSGKWTLGDCAVIVSDLAGENKDQRRLNLERYASDTKVELQSMKQYEWVSRRFPEGPIRHIAPNLSWSHYRAVVALEDPQSWLEKAADEDWSVAKLKSEVDLSKEDQKVMDEGQPCSRPGCTSPVPEDRSLRARAEVYGVPMLFCSMACLGNTVMNDLNQIRAIYLNAEAPDYATTFLVNNPDPTSDIDPEDWPDERRAMEQEYVLEKYRGLKKVKKEE